MSNLRFHLFNQYQATCCLANDQEAKLGLLETLTSQGLGAQATIYLSSIEDCYNANTATCDEYGQWCQTLYRLESGLEDTISKEIEASCTLSSRNSTTTSPRTYSNDELLENCSICNTLSCCYDADDSPSVSVAIQRKRKREPITFDAFSKGDTGPRDLSSDGSCDSFTAYEGTLNARICDAYAPYCNSLYSRHSPESLPPIIGPSNTSYYPTMVIPSYYPTISVQPSSFTTNVPYNSNSTQSLNSSIQLGNKSPAPAAVVSSTNLTINSRNASDSPTQNASAAPFRQLKYNETLKPSIAISLIPSIGPGQSKSPSSAPRFLEMPPMDNTDSFETSEKTNSPIVPSLAPEENEPVLPSVNESIP